MVSGRFLGGRTRALDRQIHGVILKRSLATKGTHVTESAGFSDIATQNNPQAAGRSCYLSKWTGVMVSAEPVARKVKRPEQGRSDRVSMFNGYRKAR